MGFQSSTPCAVLLGFFALRYLSLSREVAGEQRKGGIEGVKCKEWNLTIDFLVVVLRQEGTRRVRMGNFLLQRGLLIYILAPESCDSYMMTLLVR